MPESLKVQLDIPLETIANLLCSALEGGAYGSGYWCEIVEYIKPSELTFRIDKEKIFRHIDYPMNKGGALIVKSTEDDVINGNDRWRVDLPALHKGIQLLAEKVPYQFHQLISENDDGDTADCFLQLACFGELIFG